jgi:hypothetical protein
LRTNQKSLTPYNGIIGSSPKKLEKQIIFNINI